MTRAAVCGWTSSSLSSPSASGTQARISGSFGALAAGGGAADGCASGASDEGAVVAARVEPLADAPGVVSLPGLQPATASKPRPPRSRRRIQETG